MSEYKTAWQDMGYTHHDVACDVAVSGERCRADHDRIRALEAENARLLCDREGWAARSREQFDRIGKALDPFRLKRLSGEPDLSDASEVERLAARAKRLADENAKLREALGEAVSAIEPVTGWLESGTDMAWHELVERLRASLAA